MTISDSIIRHRNPIAAGLVVALSLFAASTAPAETCTTQSAMPAVDRNQLADLARSLALKIQSNDAPGLRNASVAEVQKDFGALQYLVAVTAPKLAGNNPIVEQLYLLDATNLKPGADGANPEAQFFCSLNRSTMEAEFDISGLPPGKYAFVIVTMTPRPGSASAPWHLSFLLRQEPAGAQGAWLISGVYPRPMTAIGHDGLWFWSQARQMAKDKQPWNAWLYYQAAQKLLVPADFITSTHLEKLRSEANSAAPPALSEGVTVEEPLVVKGADGAQYNFTALGVDDSQSQAGLDIAAHLRADPAPDPAAARKRNQAAAAALLAAYPELRKPFHGVLISAEAAGQNPFTTETPLADIR